MAFVGTVLSQPAPQVPKPVARQLPKPVTKHGEPEMPRVRQLPPIGSLGNMIRMTNRENARQQAVAKLLEVQPCPDTRFNFFKGIIAREDLRLLGWHHEIVKVETLDGVEQTTVRVHPVVTQKNGRPVRLTGETLEVYSVENNQLLPLRDQSLGSATGIIRE